jgi:hypothetical protein
MANPLIRKNPLTSLGQSGVQPAAPQIRGPARAPAPRAQTQLTSKALRVWTQALLAPAKPKKKRQS